MQGVRGETKQLEEFHNSQSWIGMSLKNAVFVPPHPDEVDELMSDLDTLYTSQDADNIIF